MRCFLRLFVALAVAVCVAGCAAQLPMPNVDFPSQYIYEDGAVARFDTLPDGKGWWQIYNDPMLDSLERVALENNRDIAVAASRIESARYALAAARAEFLPSLEAELSAESNYKTPLGKSYEIVLQPSVSWNVSLFGALRHTTREMRAEILSSEWAHRGVLLSLTKEVAQAYFTMRECNQSLNIARRSYELRQTSAALIDSMVYYGVSTALDSEQANSLVYGAAADIEQYDRALKQASLSLAVLLGQTPQPLSDSALADLTLAALPAQVPSGVPSELFGRRPDIMESYYELQAAAAKVGVARSNRFPSVALTGSGGLLGSNVKELFKDGYWSWDATAGVVQPLFAFGRLRRAEQIARANYDEAVLEYEQTVLQALEEVESALVAVATYRGQIAAYVDYVEANRRIANMTEALYRLGQNNYLDVITTRQTWYESQLQLVQLISQQYINYAELVMALGDGWEE